MNTLVNDLLSNAPLLALIGVVGGALVTGLIGLRVAKINQKTTAATQRAEERKAEAERVKAEQANTLVWQEFIQTRVDEAVKKSNEDRDRKIEALEKAITGVLGELRRVKNSFREYIRKVVLTWGRAPEPPELEKHILDDLHQDDLEGLLNDLQVAQYRSQTDEE